MSEKIKISMMTDHAFTACCNNYTQLMEGMKAHPTDTNWLIGVTKEEPFQEKNIEINDFSLVVPERGNKLDAVMQNGIILYNSLNELPDCILFDMRFWEWIAFKKGYRAALATIGADKVATMWFGDQAGNNSRRGVMLHVLARCFIMVRMSIEPDKEDKYELTRYLFKDDRCYRNMVYRNISDIPAVSHAFIRVDKAISEKYNIVLGDTINRAVMKEISNIGSVRLIDAMSEDEIFALISGKADAIVKSCLDKK